MSICICMVYRLQLHMRWHLDNGDSIKMSSKTKVLQSKNLQFHMHRHNGIYTAAYNVIYVIPKKKYIYISMQRKYTIKLEENVSETHRHNLYIFIQKHIWQKHICMWQICIMCKVVSHVGRKRHHQQQQRATFKADNVNIKPFQPNKQRAEQAMKPATQQPTDPPTNQPTKQPTGRPTCLMARRGGSQSKSQNNVLANSSAKPICCIV